MVIIANGDLTRVSGVAGSAHVTSHGATVRNSFIGTLTHQSPNGEVIDSTIINAYTVNQDNIRHIDSNFNADTTVDNVTDAQFRGCKGDGNFTDNGTDTLGSANTGSIPNTADSTGTHTTTWGGGFSPAESGNLTYSVLGDKVTLNFPDVLATLGASPNTITMTTVLPANLRPTANRDYVIRVRNDGTDTIAFMDVQASGAITVYATAAGGNFSGTMGTSGFYATSINYSTS
jgi:hypothetical protein